MHSTYLCKADFAVFGLAVTIVNVITLALEMSGAFALTTLVFRMWTIFAPVQVSTAEAWRGRIILCCGLYWLAGACSVAAVGVMVSVQRLDGRFHWRKLDSQPL